MDINTSPLLLLLQPGAAQSQLLQGQGQTVAANLLAGPTGNFLNLLGGTSSNLAGITAADISSAVLQLPSLPQLPDTPKAPDALLRVNALAAYRQGEAQVPPQVVISDYRELGSDVLQALADVAKTTDGKVPIIVAASLEKHSSKSLLVTEAVQLNQESGEPENEELIVNAGDEEFLLVPAEIKIEAVDTPDVLPANQPVSQVIVATGLAPSSTKEAQAAVLPGQAVNAVSSDQDAKKSAIQAGTASWLKGTLVKTVDTAKTPSNTPADQNTRHDDMAAAEEKLVFSKMNPERMLEKVSQDFAQKLEVGHITHAALPGHHAALPIKDSFGGIEQSIAASQAAPAEQVGFKMIGMLKDGHRSFNIQLEPADLGKVEVRMELFADGKAHLTILADKQDTLTMLQKDSQILERTLQDSGLRADAGNLQFGLRQDNQAWRQQHTYQSVAGTLIATNPNEAGEPQTGSPYKMFVSDQALNILV